MASFVEGLARGLSGLPQALMYRQGKSSKDAYKKDIAGLSSAEGPFDSEAAARVALKHGDLDSALNYRRMAADASERSAAGVRQKEQDDIKAAERTRRHATEDEASGISQRERFAKRFNPHFKAGDAEGMGGMISTHPGLIGELMNFGPGRRAVGVEKIQTPDGETRYAFQLRNARTGTTGPQTAGASADPGDNVVSYSQEQIERALQPFLPADKVDKARVVKGADGQNYWVTPDGQSSLAIPGMEAPPKKAAKLLTLQKGEDRVTLREDDPRVDGMIKDGYNTGREPLVRVEGAKDKTVQLANKITQLRESGTPPDNALADRLELKLTFGEKPPEAYAKAMSSVPSARAAISDAYRLVKKHGISGAIKPTERAKLQQAWNALVGNMVTLEARGANLTGNEERIVNGILGGNPTDLFARGLRGDESFLQALQNAAKYVETRAASIVSAYTKPFSAQTDYPWEQDAQLAAQPGPPNTQPAPPQAPELAAQPQGGPPAVQPAPDAIQAPVAALSPTQPGFLPTPGPVSEAVPPAGVIDPATAEPTSFKNTSLYAPEAAPAASTIDLATIDPKTVDPAIFATMGFDDLQYMLKYARTMNMEAFRAMNARLDEL